MVYYAHVGCDPLSAGYIDSPNQLVAYFVIDTLGIPGIQGIYVASIAAGSLTTISSVLNSIAANTWEDILSGYFPSVSTDRGVLICKILVIVYGVMSTCLSFLVASVGGTVLQFSRSLNSLFQIPIYGMFLSGMFCPWMNKVGIISGALSSCGLILWIVAGQYVNSIFNQTTLPTTTSNCLHTERNTTSASAAFINELWTNSTAYHVMSGNNNGQQIKSTSTFSDPGESTRKHFGMVL